MLKGYALFMAFHNSAGMRTTVTVFLMAFCINAAGQSQQVKVLLQQISALRTYSSYVKKGYRIAQKGLTTVSELKKGELDLHTVFYEGLENVSPAVTGYTRNNQIIRLQESLLRERSTFSQVISSAELLPEEKRYAEKVWQRLMQDCETQLEFLNTFTTDGSLGMDDAARIRRIELTYRAMADNFAFAREFTAQVAALAAIRARERRDITTARKFNNIYATP